MATPTNNSTPISLLGIQREVFNNNYSASNTHSDISLTDLSEEADENFNANSPSKPDGNTPHSMSEWYNYDHDATPPFAWTNDSGGLGNAPFSVTDSSTSTTTVAILQFGLSYQAGSHRVRMRLQKSGGQGNGVLATASYITFADYNSSNTDPNSCEVKCDWDGAFTGHETGSSASYEPTSSFGGSWTKDTYRTMATSTSDAFSGFTNGEWKVTRGSSLGSAFYRANDATSGQNSPTWTVRAKDSNGTVLDTTSGRGPNAGSFIMTATRNSGFGGGGGGGFGGDICIHEDHLVHTERGLMHIDKVRETDPKIYGYNKDTGKVELEDLIKISIVSHDNLYKINNLMLTEDHIMYAEDYTPVSVNPELAKKNYGKDSRKIQLNDRLMKYDGGVEKVTSIERYEGVHRTYTIKTALDNFYADGVLVDSEI